jgi:hypothetical protein
MISSLLRDQGPVELIDENNKVKKISHYCLFQADSYFYWSILLKPAGNVHTGKSKIPVKNFF